MCHAKKRELPSPARLYAWGAASYALCRLRKPHPANIPPQAMPCYIKLPCCRSRITASLLRYPKPYPGYPKRYPAGGGASLSGRAFPATRKNRSSEISNDLFSIRKTTTGYGALHQTYDNLTYREQRTVAKHLGFCDTCWSVRKAVLINGEIEYRPIKPMTFEGISHSASRRSDKASQRTYNNTLEKMRKTLLFHLELWK